MTTDPAAGPAIRPRLFTPTRLLAATAHLTLVGMLWPVVFMALATAVAMGVAMAPLAGIGLLLLVGAVYALYGFGWLETARVEGLYGFGLVPRRLRRSERHGFTGWLRSLGLQLADGSMWRALASAAAAMALGMSAVFCVQTVTGGVVVATAPLLHPGADIVMLPGISLVVPMGAAPAVGVVAALLGLAGLVGAAALHGVIARAILVPSREAQLTAAARTSAAQRVGAVHAADVERTRIERDLHDGVQPRLVSVGMTLGMAQNKIDSDPQAARELIAQAHASTKSAITELRQLARGIHASILDDRGLDAALSALAGRSPVPVTLDVDLTRRCSPSAETAVYFVIAESLTNAAKHARATGCRVTVRQREDGTLWARVEDDGRGGAHVVPGGGLDGLSNRVLGVGGRFRLDSPEGGPTAVEVSVPCAF